MELNLDEQHLIATYRRLNESGKRELSRLADSLLRGTRAATATEPEASSGSCKIAREEVRPENAAEPLTTE